MCRFDQGFILCTCAPGSKPVVHNKHSRRHKNKPVAEEPVAYTWSLHRYAGLSESSMVGLYRLPQHDIGQGLTSEWVLLHLNHGNCFDFEYTPMENDCLRIGQGKTFRYLAFVYKDGKWKMDVHDPFLVEEKLLLEGNVKETGR